MRWGEFEEKVRTIYGLDPPVEPLIVALWAHGFPTDASCGGHTGKELKIPWVTFRPHAHWAKRRASLPGGTPINIIVASLEWLLEVFHRRRDPPPPMERRLTTRILFPEHQVASLRFTTPPFQGSPAEEEALVRILQEELRLFAGFLKELFLKEGPLLTEDLEAQRLVDEEHRGSRQNVLPPYQSKLPTEGLHQWLARSRQAQAKMRRRDATRPDRQQRW